MGSSAGSASASLSNADTVTITGNTTFQNKSGSTITFNDVMVKNATTIATTIAAMNPKGVELTQEDRERLFKMAIMTGLQESYMGTAPNMKDCDDVGIFQERSLVGWYADEATQAANKEKLQDVAYQTTNLVMGHDTIKGYHIFGLLDMKAWRTDPLWKVIADTQRPAEQYRQEYDKWEPVAESLLASFKGLLTGSSQAGCSAGSELLVTHANILSALSPTEFSEDLRTIVAKNPGVIALNEVSKARKAQIHEIAESNGYTMLIGSIQANTILVRNDIGAVTASGEVEVHGKMQGNDERAILWVTIDLGSGTPLTVLTTHALPGIESKGNPSGPKARWEAAVKSFSMFVQLAKEKAAEGMVIGTGDMNVDYARDKREEYPGFPWTAIENRGQGEGLRSTFTLAGLQATGTLGDRNIDYVYGWQSSSSPLKLTGYTIESNVNSDHNFVDATFTTGVEATSSSEYVGAGGTAAGSTARLTATTKAGFLEFRDKFPAVKSIGGWRAGSKVSVSDHPKGMAIDVMIPNYKSAAGKALGDAVAEYAIANASRLKIKYIIWRQRSYKFEYGKKWKQMASRGSDTDNHYDHVHISFQS